MVVVGSHRFAIASSGPDAADAGSSDANVASSAGTSSLWGAQPLALRSLCGLGTASTCNSLGTETPREVSMGDHLRLTRPAGGVFETGKATPARSRKHPQRRSPGAGKLVETACDPRQADPTGRLLT